MRPVPNPKPTPYRLVLEEVAEAQVDETYEYLMRFGFATAESWLKGLQDLLNRECELQAARLVGREPTRELGTEQDVYVLRYLTRNKSLWRVLFRLDDADEDGLLDTLTVLRVRSAAQSAGGIGGVSEAAEE